MDGSTVVWILGGYQSDFARNLSKENRDFAAQTAEVVEGTLAAAKVNAAEIADVDGFEVPDCFTPTEYLAMDHIGLTGPGESWKAVENGEIEIGGRLPINPSRGLIGGGHPVVASGVRMLLHAAKQVSGRRRLPGRGCENLRHPELRRQHRHHRQFRCQ